MRVFLKALADDRFVDFRLGTAKHAHLYCKGDFYIYTKPNKNVIELHSTFMRG